MQIMLIQTLKALFLRDLEKLKEEIGLYRDEQAIWRTAEGISNSGGNLCLHLVGNLNNYIGAELGKTGYIRQRDLEFSLKDVPLAELLHMIDKTIEVVGATLDGLTNEQLAEEYPVLVFSGKMSTEYFLVHLLTHLSYHLGQINYHRRLLDK
jgi:uncharacterized damage-inducible protein DinB